MKHIEKYRSSAHIGFALLASAVLLYSFGCSGDTNTVPTSNQTVNAASGLNSEAINRKYNYAPSSRLLAPRSVFRSADSVASPQNILMGQSTRLGGNGAFVTLDFGQEVAGIVTIRFAGASDSSQQVGLAFSESSLYVGTADSDHSSGGAIPDGVLYATISGPGSYTMPVDKLRGGFRYLTIFLTSNGWVDLNNVSLHFSAMPGLPDPQSYTGYFYCDDDLLNRIWYAGAYTVQLNTVDPTQGRHWPPPSSGWLNDAFIGPGQSVLVDGAKRDRTVWPGDLAIAQATAFVSTNDLASMRNTIDLLYAAQKSDGEMPYAGPPINMWGSDTYHMWSLVGTADYVLYSGDKAWLSAHWQSYKSGVQFLLNKIDSNGVLSVDGISDWGRSAESGGEVIEANALFYHVLVTGAELARIAGDSSQEAAYTSAASNLRRAVNQLFWDGNGGEYANSPGSTLHPQDGNSLALWFGLVDSQARAMSVSGALRQNWNTFGAQTPEKPNAISSFTGSMEVHAHFAGGDDQTGLDLIRRQWGYMLNSAIGTKSTFWEGYLADGKLEPATPGGVSWYPPPLLGSYMSLAHGWSTGPTSALTFFVLGVSPTRGGEVAYTEVPHPGDLTHAEGTLVLPSGPIIVSWTRDKTADIFTETLVPPSGALGTIGVPTFHRPTVVYIDKRLVWNGCAAKKTVANIGFKDAATDGSYVYLQKMHGSHIITSTSECP